MQNRRLKFRGRATTPGAIAEGDRYLAYTLFSGFSSISNIKSRQEERDFLDYISMRLCLKFITSVYVI